MAPDAATSDGYTSKSGTSMATPLMAGIAALMVEANPDITHEQVKSIISSDSIERDLQLLDDPGFNDCSILESRPDNELDMVKQTLLFLFSLQVLLTLH